MAIAPTVRGLILSESADVDPVTKNISLRECFRALVSHSFPSTLQPFFVFAHLVNGWGDVLLRIDIVSLNDNNPIYRFTNRVLFRDRLQEMRLKVEIAQFIAPAAGKYGIKLWANSDLIALTDFTVIGGVS